VIEIGGLKEWEFACSQIEGCETIFYPKFWSLDGKYLYLNAGRLLDSPDKILGTSRGLSRLELNTGQLLVVLPAITDDESTMYEFSFSPDGEYLMYTLASYSTPIVISVININSGNLINFPLPEQYLGAGWISWSPFESKFIFNAVTNKQRGNLKKAALFIVNVDEENIHEILVDQEHLSLVLEWLGKDIVYLRWYDVVDFNQENQYRFLNIINGNLSIADPPTPTP